MERLVSQGYDFLLHELNRKDLAALLTSEPTLLVEVKRWAWRPKGVILVEKESTTKLASASMKRTLLAFIVGGFILNFAVIMVYDICKIVWIDFLHYNPNRSQADALYLMANSPIVALIFTLLYSTLPVIVGAIVAMASHQIWKRVPFYSLIIMLPLCVIALYIATGANRIDYGDFLLISLRQLPVLVGCWWWSNRTPKV